MSPVITNEMRRGWLVHAQDQGDSHLAVPVQDYEDILDLLDLLEERGQRPWFRWVQAAWLILMAGGFGWGLVRTFCG